MQQHLVGFMVCGKGEGKRQLPRALACFKRLCDDAVVVGNNTDPYTEGLIRKAGYWFYRDDREWGLHQPDIKTDLLKRFYGLHPTLVLPLDADEEYGAAFTKAEAIHWGTKYPACYFHIENMWGDMQHYRRSMGFWNIRMFQWRPVLGVQYQRQRVHCGLGPPWTYNVGAHIPHIVKHYGLMGKANRASKVARYAKYDPQAKFKGQQYYDALRDDVQGTPWDEAVVQAAVAAEVATYGSQIKTLRMATPEQFVYIRRLADGRTLDVSRKDWDNWSPSRRAEFELVGTADATGVPPSEVVQAPEAPAVPKVYACPICGEQFGSRKELNAHKKAHA